MIIEKRREIRKCLKNNGGMPDKSVGLGQGKAKASMLMKWKNVKEITYRTYQAYSAQPSDWGIDPELTTVTMPRFVMFVYALLTGLVYFAIGSYFLA